MMGLEAILDRFPSARVVEAKTEDDEVTALVEARMAGLPCVISRAGQPLWLPCFSDEMRREVYRG